MRKVTTRKVSVNIAKFVTIFILLALPFFYTVHTRQAVYLALHVGYCLWYLLKQRILHESIFPEKDSLADVIIVVVVVGIFYALPGFLAFRNPTPVSEMVLAASIVLFFFGSVINSGADIQKSIVLQTQHKLVSDGFWALSRNINYFGDILRYSALALLSGSIWSLSVVLTVIAISFQRSQKKKVSLYRYPEYGEYIRTVPAFFPIGFIPDIGHNTTNKTFSNKEYRPVNVKAIIEVDIPVKAAFEYYCDPSSLRDWCVGGHITEFTAITPPPKQVGSRYLMAYSLLGVTFCCIAELTRLDYCKLSIKEMVYGDYKAYRYEMHFTPIDENCTRLEMRIHVVFPWGYLGAIALQLCRSFVRRDIQGGLQRFKRGAEARHRSSNDFQD